ncbi:hypothetical protein HN51_042285 [Arachis hypogaea]|nr:uncharacterized protein LOC107495896 [Arachis duranensis]XP_025606860.1 uncharacterized protein LOC112697759 [Arachis hypogaea]
MKVSGFWPLFFLLAVAAALAFLNFLSSDGGSNFSDLPVTNYGHGTSEIVTRRKLKENDSKRTSKDKVDNRLINLDDYAGKNGPYKAVRTEPIEHGTPYLPFLPRPPPPDLPSPDGYSDLSDLPSPGVYSDLPTPGGF